MSRRITLLMLSCLLAGPPHFAMAAAGGPKPNVVFILADDLGCNDLPLYGSSFHETPHIDALAQRGMVFDDAYSASPLCSPTRASILTGLSPARVGITAPVCHVAEEVLEKRLVAQSPPAQRALLAESLTRLKTAYYTLAEAFKAQGYRTAHFGKWHLGRPPYSPLEHGFDVDIPHTWNPSPMPSGFFYPFPSWPQHGRPGDHLEDLVCDQAVEFIRAQGQRPFFLNYWAFEVHSPWQAKDRQIAKYRAKASPQSLQRNAVYAGMVETLDEVVGRLVAALDGAGVLDNTVLVFTSDNGPYFTPNSEHMPEEFRQVPVTSAHPLRAGKGTIYEGGTRVPLVVVWPGRVRPGTRSRAMVESVDFFPTMADMLAWKLPDGLSFDGISQRRTWEGKGASRQEVFCHFPHNQVSAPYEQMPAPTSPAPASSLRQGDWKLIRFYADGPQGENRHELYHLGHDAGETRNLAATEPEIVRRLGLRLDELLHDTAAVVPRANPRFNEAGGLPRGKAAAGPAKKKGPPSAVPGIGVR